MSSSWHPPGSTDSVYQTAEHPVTRPSGRAVGRHPDWPESMSDERFANENKARLRLLPTGQRGSPAFGDEPEGSRSGRHGLQFARGFPRSNDRVPMTHTELLWLLESLVEFSPGTLCGPELLSGLAGWDSLTQVTFVMHLERLAGIRLSAIQVGNCRTVQDLLALVEAVAPHK